MEGKDLPSDAYYFYHNHSSLFSKSHFDHLFLFFLLLLSISYSDCLGHCCCHPYGYCSYLCAKSNSCNFSFLPLLFTNHFVYCSHFSGVPNALWPDGLNLHKSLTVDRTFSLFHYPLHNKLSSTCSVVYAFLSLFLPLNGKTLSLFLSFPSSTHQVVSAGLLPILGKDAFLAVYPPKEVMAGYQN